MVSSSEMIRAIETVLQIKHALINCEDGSAEEKALYRITVKGRLTVAHHIDILIETILTYESMAAQYRGDLRHLRGTLSEWEKLGFLDTPDQMTKDQRHRLQKLAEEFAREEPTV